jgi:xanthine dehydrogenase accessory factor
VYLSDYLVVVRGGGGLGTAVAHRLLRSGFTVLVTELAQPLAVRRGAAFAEAVYRGQAQVEGVTARLANDAMLGMAFTVVGELPVLVDMADDVLARMRPAIAVDARPAGAQPVTRREDARLVIGLGPGFTAGQDCHVVIETRAGSHLGRVYWDSDAAPANVLPRPDEAGSRLLWAPVEGIFTGHKTIGDTVLAGEDLGSVEGQPLAAPFTGVLRGLLHDGVPVAAGLKVAELDPTIAREQCFLISPAARSVAGGVLEATLAGMDLWRREDEGRLAEDQEPLPVTKDQGPLSVTDNRRQ